MKLTVSILVADPEPMIRNLLTKILSRDGYTIIVAEDSEAALSAMENNAVDIIISDSKMPGLDGFELLKIVKQKYPRTVLIMMTAYGDTYMIKDALLLGADEYITKPFKSFEISLVVERAYWRLLSRTGEASPQII